jgi:2',3'-cyclic-nucleotide 2'-phosphodiesterase/3'-nucleotidase/5'-nucleotidase
MKRLLTATVCGWALAAGAAQALSFEALGQYRHGSFKKSAAEIVAFDKTSKRLFVVNGESKGIDVLDASDPKSLKLVQSVSMSAYGADVNSVAVKNGVVVVAVEASPKQANGSVVLVDAASMKVVKQVPAGPLPDSVNFSPDGRYVVSANEGEPSADYTNDPEGSVTIVDVSGGAANAKAVTAGFSAFTWDKLTGVKPGKKGQTFAQDAEPEYIAYSPDSKTAYVTLQEVNAIATVDLTAGKVVSVKGLGFKDWSKVDMDASDRDGDILFQKPPVWGMYQPDSIASFTAADGKTYLVTANEGDAREYEGYSEEKRGKDLVLDAATFPNPVSLQGDSGIGRLKVTDAIGDTDGDGDFDKIYAYGARSMSVWSTDVELVADTGDEMEKALAALGAFKKFNPNHEENGGDLRSDDKGPEPEGLTIGVVGGVIYAFVGQERAGWIVAYDLTDPKAPKRAGAISTRDYDKAPAMPEAGDLGPEGLTFISAEDSPTGEALLAVAYEVSSTTRLFRVKP